MGEGEVVCPADALGDALAVVDADAEGDVPADAEGLGESTLTGLESNTTPHTLQVLCSVPI